MPLTELEAKYARRRDRPYKLTDGAGLFLLVQPNGSKLWRMKYRLNGKEKLLSFGAYPTLGIAAAREKRDAAKAMLAEGKDPGQNRSEINPEKGETFLVVAQRWHANRASALDPAHAQRVWSRLERDVFPEFGARLMHEITPPDVLAMASTDPTAHLNSKLHSVCDGQGLLWSYSSPRGRPATIRGLTPPRGGPSQTGTRAGSSP